MTRADKLSCRLSQICLGREGHADQVFLSAIFDPRGAARSVFRWADASTGQSGWVGSAPHAEADAIVAQLFAQLRAWRERCRRQRPIYHPPPGRASVAAGGAQ